MNATAHRFWNVAIALGLGLRRDHADDVLRHELQAPRSARGEHRHRAGRRQGHPGRNLRRRRDRQASPDEQERHPPGGRPGAISSAGQVHDLVVTQTVFAGEQVTTRRFGTRAQQGLRSQLHGTQRAFQLPGDANQLLAERSATATASTSWRT